MTNVENENKTDSSHDFNLYVDRQLQNKLLQIDEDSDIEAYENKLSKQGNNVKTGRSGKYDSKTDDIAGWFPSAKFVARKCEFGANGVKPAEQTKASTFIHPWKDYRAKKEESFVFKHYTEYRKYIEQYRNEHGCHNSRFPSGNQFGEGRRVAFQMANSQQQGSVQQFQQQQQYLPTSAPSVTSNQAGLIFANRKEQLGTLMTGTPNSSASTCTCGSKQSSADTSSHYAHKYKLSPGKFPRNNTTSDLRAQLDSDNSSESGEARVRPTSRRSNSATSLRSRPVAKTPTKITVPASPNQRPYPMQALTIQQNVKTEACSSPRPLDNLNCVAPEKQHTGLCRGHAPKLDLALQIHSINDLLSANDAPFKGCTQPKSMPLHTNAHNNDLGSAASDSDDDDDNHDEDDNNDEDGDEFVEDEIISIDRLSSCQHSTDVRSRRRLDYRSSQTLKKFLKDPMLSSLNQKPELKNQCQSCLERHEKGRHNLAAKLRNGDTFLLPQNDMDAMLRVNMWNPIVSTHVNRSNENSNYRNLMNQQPFRRGLPDLNRSAPIENDLDRVQYCEPMDFFNPIKKVRLSITRLDNAVSFCRTHVQNTKTNNARRDIRGTHSAGSRTSKEDNSEVTKQEHYDQYAMKLKPTIHDPFVEKLIKPTRFEQKIMPLPSVKGLDTTTENNYSRDTGSLATKQQFADKNKPDSDILAKSSNDSSEKSDSVKKTDTVPSGGNKCVTFAEPDLADKDTTQKNKKVATGDNDTPREENEGSDSENKSQNLTATGVTIITVKDRREELKEGVKESIKTLQGVKITIDSKKQSRENGRKSRESSSRHGRVTKKPPVASGRHLRTDPELEGLTWAEKLEILRSVNKPPERPKVKRQKLKFIKADSDHETFVWSTEHEQLYEQRRIRHLVEQSRIKGGKQLDWVYDTQMHARGFDLGTAKMAGDNGASSGESGHSEAEEMKRVETQGCGEKIGVCIDRKTNQLKLFSSHSID